MTLTRVGSTTLDMVNRAPSGGICVWDYSYCYDVDPTTGRAQRTSPVMPRVSGEFSPFGIGTVDTDGSFWVACCSGPGKPKFRHLSKDFSTWTAVGTVPSDPDIGFYTAGVVRLGTTLITMFWRYSTNQYSMVGYAMDGDTLLWEVPLLGLFGDNDDENGPETLRCDTHRYLYFTVEGSVVYQFDALAHSSTPIRLFDLNDDSAHYYEKTFSSPPDPRLDIDLNAAWPHTDGFIYTWGSNDALTHGSTDRNSVFAYRADVGGSVSLIGEGVDPVPNLTRNYRSFSGTCCVRGNKLYLLNDHLEPYISSFDINTGAYTTVEIALQGPPSFDPASINGFFGLAPGTIRTGKLLGTDAKYTPIRPLA